MTPGKAKMTPQCIWAQAKDLIFGESGEVCCLWESPQVRGKRHKADGSEAGRCLHPRQREVGAPGEGWQQMGDSLLPH